MVFYFFKVTLSYFDDEKTEFFVTPDQSETDDEGIPFSENDLQNTSEFKEFVKKTKADVIDVDYIEFAAEIDPKKSEEILNNPITSEMFRELESGRQLQIVDENQFLLILKKTKKSKGKSNGGIFAVIGIAIVLLLAVGAMSQSGKHTDDTTTTSDMESEVESSAESDNSEISDSYVESEISEISSSTSESESTAENEESSSETDSENSDESDDISDNSEIMESDDGESFDFPPPEDISHLREESDVQ